MNRKYIFTILFLIFVLACCGCTKYTLEDYATYGYANSSEYADSGKLLKDYYDVYLAGNIVLIDEYGTKGILHLSRPSTYVELTVTDVKIFRDSKEYAPYINENERLKEWFLKGISCRYDPDNNEFTSPYTDVGVTVFAIQMVLNNPSDIEQEISFCSLKLLERDDKTGSFKRLNTAEDYIYDPGNREAQSRDRYTMAPHETFETTMWCIMPSKRVLEHYDRRNEKGQQILKESEEFDEDSIYLRLNSTGNTKLAEGENFIKITQSGSGKD